MRNPIVMVQLVVMIFAGCRAAIIPNLMFARPAVSQHQQPSAQHHNWMKSSSAEADQHQNSYGFLNRHPSVDSLMMEVRQEPAPVYGVAHHYVSDPVPTYYDPAEELYNANPLLFRRASRWSPSTKQQRTYAAAYYDDALMDDLLQTQQQQSGGLNYATSAEESVAEPAISQEDIINFEKYVQRYFQQQQADPTGEDYWASLVAAAAAAAASADDTADDVYDDDQQQQPFNDEEAARQLHLLLNQQRRSPAIREIQKKSGVTVGATSAAPSSSTTVTTSTPMPTTTTTAAVHHHQQGGQKEEAMLRPPTPQRPSSSPAPTMMASSTVQPAVDAEEEAKVESDLYKTIHRLVAMREQLQDDENSKLMAETSNELEEEANRMKRFVAPESSLSAQLHSLDKIRA